MNEAPQMLPSLSSWAYKGISAPELVAPAAVTEPTNVHLQGDFVSGSSILPPPPVYASVDGVGVIYGNDTYYVTHNNELIPVAPQIIEDNSAHLGHSFEQHHAPFEQHHAPAEEYYERPHVPVTPPPEAFHTDPHSDVSWETEAQYLSPEDATLETSYWQSEFLSHEDEARLNPEDHDRTKKLTGQQRIAANRRERKRMNTINQAFETLRLHLPILECERKLSKADSLRVAADYIKFMSHILATTTPKPAEFGGRGDRLLITKKVELDSDTYGVREEYTVSVLLTWSRNRKCDNSVTTNGRKKIRAPIWHPEYPGKVQNKYKRSPKPNSYSLGQIFVAGTCEEPPSKTVRLEDIPMINDQYGYGLGTQRQGDIYVNPTHDEHGSSVMVEQLHSPCYANYIQTLPELSCHEEAAYPFYNTSVIQSTKSHYAQDVLWHSSKYAPSHSHAVDPDRNEIQPTTLKMCDVPNSSDAHKRYYSAAFSTDPFPHFVYSPSPHIYQHYTIQGRDITAL